MNIKTLFRKRTAALKLAGFVIVLALLLGVGLASKPVRAEPGPEPYGYPARTAMVHLFEWKWTDIARECEEVLGPKGYSAVQVSPPNEHAEGENWYREDGSLEHISYPWWQRYQAVTYQLNSRSGTRAEFINMVERCHVAGVAIYVDVVINHTTGVLPSDTERTGSAGTPYHSFYTDNPDDGYIFFPNIGPEVDVNGDGRIDPGEVAQCSDGHGGMVNCQYTSLDFNDCNQAGAGTVENDIPSWAYGTGDGHADLVRNCELANLLDLKTGIGGEYVRGRIVAYLNSLVDLGVDGFRVDAVKHMHQNDVLEMISAVQAHADSVHVPRPYFYLEVIDAGNESVNSESYLYPDALNTDITEFKYENLVADTFKSGDIRDFEDHHDGVGWEWSDQPFLSSGSAVAFIDMHDSQRSNDLVYTYKDRQQYILANVFMLAHTYGYPQVMSSYKFTDNDQGPPTNDDADLSNTDSVWTSASTSDCSEPDSSPWHDWICEHRWTAIAGMVGFRNYTAEAWNIANWYAPSTNQIAFSRQNPGENALGFVAINDSNIDMPLADVTTGTLSGIYCNVVKGEYDPTPPATCMGDSGHDEWILIDRSGIVYSDNIREWNGTDWIPVTVAAHDALAIHVGAKLDETNCTAERAARMYQPPKPQYVFNSLYDFRDKIMYQTPQGKQLASDYYEYSLNMSAILLQKPSLAGSLWQVLEWTTPALDRYMNHKYDQKDIFTTTRYNKINTIYNTIITYGDNNLAQKVKGYWNQIPLKSYIGLPMDTVIYKAVTIFIGTP